MSEDPARPTFADPALAFGPAALHRAFLRAQQHHRRDPEAAACLLDLGPRLCALSRSLLAGTWRPSPVRSFPIRDPKPRIVVQARFADRIVHHALVAELERVIDPLLDPDSFACRKGKGLHRAVKRAQELFGGQAYALALDIRHYFARLPHRVILSALAGFEAPQPYLELCTVILEADGARDPGDESRGMPIGLLTSQFFGNLGLHPVEMMLRREHPLLAHVRYMDDLLVLGPDRRSLWRAHGAIGDRLGAMGLELKAEATRLLPVTEGIPFCGLRIFRGLVRPTHRAFGRVARRVRCLAHAAELGHPAAERTEASLLSLFAHVGHWDTQAARQSLVRALWP